MRATMNQRVTLHEGRVFRLVRENVTLENGVTIDLDIIRHPGASAIVPLTENNTLFMIKQYRHAAGGFIWEIPAGTLDPNESPLECAKRELVEETGFSANKWQKLGEITPVPGYSDERIHIFCATDLAPARQDLDMDEILHVHEVRFDDAIAMIQRGEIQDGKTISGLFMASLWLNDGVPACSVSNA
ncbi:MAG: NUDIX hydrolase [Desulfobacterales bacterium]|nr:NUDIX hydrolase [Desulfobacterales bacterium]MBL7171324.1 NUDIX hydrolase [Desulfobacteraceae bacterium]